MSKVHISKLLSKLLHQFLFSPPAFKDIMSGSFAIILY
jgi:hypothetical protein